MSRPLILIASLVGLTGCIIHDNDCTDDGFWSDDDPSDGGAQDDDGDGWPDEPGDDTDDGSDLGFSFDPATLAQGQTAIVSLTAQVEFDWSAVAELQLYGDVEPCTMSARADELLVTLSVYDAAALGTVDMVIELQDGRAFWVDDALTIVAAGDGSTDDTGDGSTDGSTGGTGDGSTGGSTGGSGDGSTGGSGSTGGC